MIVKRPNFNLKEFRIIGRILINGGEIYKVG